jgi:hypothetical protein
MTAVISYYSATGVPIEARPTVFYQEELLGAINRVYPEQELLKFVLNGRKQTVKDNIAVPECIIAKWTVKYKYQQQK